MKLSKKRLIFRIVIALVLCACMILITSFFVLGSSEGNFVIEALNVYEGTSVCGTPRWYNEWGTSDITPISKFNAHLETPSENVASTYCLVTLTLPDGFSFKEDSIERTTTMEINSRWHEYTLRIPTIYPIYLSDAYEGKEYTINVALSCTVEYGYYTSNYPYYNFEVTGTGFEYSEADIPFFSVTGTVSTGATVVDSNLGGVGVEWSTNLFAKGDNTEKAELCAILSSAAYDESECITFLDDLGFTDIEKKGVTGINLNACGRYYAYKKIIVDGEINYFVICILRGTAGVSEWFGNFNVGNGTTHAGFDKAASYVKDELTEYCSDNGMSPSNTLFLLTGHSKGAAVANLVAHWLNQNSAIALQENVTAYTFATPTVVTASEATSDINIFNYVYYQDVIRNSPSMQCYGRYGITLFLDMTSHLMVLQYIL